MALANLVMSELLDHLESKEHLGETERTVRRVLPEIMLTVTLVPQALLVTRDLQVFQELQAEMEEQVLLVQKVLKLMVPPDPMDLLALRALLVKMESKEIPDQQDLLDLQEPKDNLDPLVALAKRGRLDTPDQKVAAPPSTDLALQALQALQVLLLLLPQFQDLQVLQDLQDLAITRTLTWRRKPLAANTKMGNNFAMKAL